MSVGDLTVTIQAAPRPWWRPLGLKALRKWYREARRHHGRLLSAAIAVLIARKEFRFHSHRKVIA